MEKINTKKINCHGFSIIEIMVIIAITILVGLAGWTFQENVLSLNKLMSGNLIIQQEARQIFRRISSEIRSISPSSTGAYPILEASSTSFTFYSDIDDDGLKEQIRYFLEDGTFKKGELKPTGNPLNYNPADEKISKVVHNVYYDGTPIFDYYDSNYDGSTAALTQPVDVLNIRLVKITLYVNQDPNRPPASAFITTQVSMRNLKDNL